MSTDALNAFKQKRETLQNTLQEKETERNVIESQLAPNLHDEKLQKKRFNLKIHIIIKRLEKMEYLSELIWLSLWPVVIYLGYKISYKNAIKEIK